MALGVRFGRKPKLAPFQRQELLARLAHGETQMELAHANRVATMGQLSASIAHEVNQPIAATVTNAAAALRWLHAGSSHLEKVQQSLTSIVEDGTRAGEVINRIRALMKKAPPRKDRLEINGVIVEIIELTRGEAMKYGISVLTELADHLPVVEADRVQLQQVLLNLIVNALDAMGAPNEGPGQLLISTGKEPAACWSRCRIRVRDLRQRCSSGCSSPSTQRSPPV